MNAFEINKIIGWTLAALLVIFGGRTLMDVYNGGHGGGEVVKTAYNIEVEEAGAAKTNAGDKKDAPAADIKTLLKTADIASGEKQAKKCKACHTFEKGGKNKIGPALYDVVNRKVGTASGFSFSEAMKGKGGDWSYEALAAFLKAPKKDIPGTAMAFGGIKNDEKLADLIAFLRTKSDNPAPLPK